MRRPVLDYDSSLDRAKMEGMHPSNEITIERTPTGALPVIKPLLHWRVLVPRGGKWGDGVAAQLRSLGAQPVIAPLINFAASDDPDRLAVELNALQRGEVDWLVVTSATTVDVLVGHGVSIPPTTRVAAVGESTAQALQLAGYDVDFVPGDHSARGLVRDWPHSDRRPVVLVPQSQLADPTLVRGLRERDVEARFVTAYRTVGVRASQEVARSVAEGDVNALLVSSGSVARQIAEQFGPLPSSTAVICVGPRTAFDARAAGLGVHRIAEERSRQALVQALVDYVMNPNDASPPVTA